MELRVIDKTDEELRLEVAGEDHTFMNVLKGALLETEGVDAATYDVNPQQSGGQTEPILTVKTIDSDPLDAVEAAVDNVTDKTAALRDEVEAV